ncbi:MAG: hypothetical protein IH949_09715 [Bacteroidetes bacterium]|nr:hypothetical protein [Bacteroidota bacterium]
MTSIEAEKIIENYHNSIKDLRPVSIVQPESDLPYVKGWIRYAHFVYGEELIKQNILSKDIAEMLIESYSLLDEYFVEEPKPVNEQYREFISGLKKGTIFDFYMPNPFGNTLQALEYLNFLGERLIKLDRDYILKDDKGEDILLPAYIYKGLYDKALKEKDLNLCIEMVNTRLTRAVHFPGEKSNAESIFIKSY